MAYSQIAVICQTIEMMAGDVGMDVEELRHLGRRQGLGRLPHRDVDGAAGRVTQR
jgi:hypothetical protein